jgi:hypothetical protein
MATLKANLEALRTFVGGATTDPFDPKRWDVDGDFWWYRKWQYHMMAGDHPPAWFRDYWPKGKGAPVKPPGWDEWEGEASRRISENRISTEELLEIIRRNMKRDSVEEAELPIENERPVATESKTSALATTVDSPKVGDKLQPYRDEGNERPELTGD